jgi:hypothetical protein
MPTAGEIIQDALELLQIYGPGDQISAADSARALSTLNDMLDVWSNESLACYAILTQSFPLVVGQSTYTVGPGGQIDGPRPLRLIDQPGSAYLLDENQNRYLMTVLDEMRWNMQTTAVANSDLPDLMWYDPQFPLGVINIWPTPAIGFTCSFTSYLQLADFADLTSPFSLPPGYKRAITTNLALSLKPYFATAQIDPLILDEARTTKASVKRTNMRPQVATYDPEIVARGQNTYNIYSDRGTGRP